MVWIVLLAALFCFISIRMQFGRYVRYPLIESTIGRVVAVGLWTIIGAVLGLGLGAGTAAGAGAMPNQTTCDNPVNTQLYSMRGDNNLAGSFLYIDTEYTYHYFDSDSGAISEHNLDGQMGELYEDSTPQDAHVANYSLEYQWYWRPFVIGGGGWGCKTQFHVPPGSVSRAIQAAP